MASLQALIAISEMTESEAARKSYPEDFPALPEIPGGRYTSSEFYDLEMQHLWRKVWLYAAHASELPEVGSYKLFTRLGFSIILSRGADGAIRAFHNSCRHRGSPLLTEGSGRAKRFICPYHAWGYSLEGKLTSVPQAQNFCGLDRGERGLLPVRCETWRGLVFICLDDDAMPLLDYLGSLPSQMEDRFPLEEMEVKRTATISIDCNWKAAYDNFVEIYHAKTVHPTTIAPFFDEASFSISLYANGHSRYVVRRTSEMDFAVEGTPTLEGVDALFRKFTMGVMPFPNMIGAMNPNGYPWVTFWPTGPRTVDMEVQLVAGKGGDAAHWDNTMEYFLKFFDEDITLLSGVQKSLDAGFLTGILTGYAERIIYWYHEEIDRVIGYDRIPPALAVEPVLAPYATASL